MATNIIATFPTGRLPLVPSTGRWCTGGPRAGGRGRGGGSKSFDQLIGKLVCPCSLLPLSYLEKSTKILGRDGQDFNHTSLFVFFSYNFKAFTYLFLFSGMRMMNEANGQIKENTFEIFCAIPKIKCEIKDFFFTRGTLPVNQKPVRFVVITI